MLCRATSSAPSSRAWPCCGASVGTSVGSRIGVDMEAGYLLHAPAQVVEQVDAGDQAEEAAAVGAAVIGNDRHMAAIEHRQQGLDRRLHVEPVALADHREIGRAHV